MLYLQLKCYKKTKNKKKQKKQQQQQQQQQKTLVADTQELL